MGMPNITDLCQKYVTIATSLEGLKKENQTDHAHPNVYQS